MYLLSSVFVLLILCLTPAARAWESYPEFQSLTETEQSAFEGPSRFGSEYPGDLLSYMKPARWEYEWLIHRNALDLNLGSVSSAHFAMDGRLKVNVPLQDYLEFRFTYLDERNRERESVHHILEFVFWPSAKLGFSLYGEPSLYKRDNDTGLALLLRPTPRHEIRIFNTFVDVTRLKRNDRNDNFIEPWLPYSRGIVGRLWSAPESGRRDFLEYSARYDARTQWHFPDEGYTYEYWKVFGSLYGNKTVTEKWDLNLRMQFDRKFESRSVPSTTWTTERFFALLGSDVGGIGPGGSWLFSPGIEFTERNWKTDQGVATYRDFLPHFWVKIPTVGEGARQDHLNVGFVLNWHRAFGPLELRDPQDADARIEQKLNLGYEFSFGETGKLILLATGDLDRFFTDKSWDGGSGQLQLFF